MSDDVAASTGARGPRPPVEDMLGEHLQQWFPRFVGWIVSKGGIGQHDAENIVSEAYTRVYERMMSAPEAADRWEDSDPKERTKYVRTTVANEAANHLRKQRSLQSLEDQPDEPDADADPAEIVVRAAEAMQALENLRALSQRDRDVLIPMEGASQPEQALMLGMSHGAFRTALTRARKRYAAKFPQHHPEDI
ncbi:sigma-70 family RNA polymerase sigma factor (plasmid) [Streptomyces sp. NBC_01362]|uniref:RNA polymerase sigma factor n=1 Tax=Streptomyces sp. NBC_01362 TaxID=2903839 RepID=UPI002E32F4B6|nr:sigma-70 family RNA polymerase sigma factor [Streptomyces sp. NBC_01362]